MKKIILYIVVICFFCFLSNISYAQTPDWTWAKSAGKFGNDFGSCVHSDANGNVYVAGLFTSNTITFGSTTLSNTGDYDIFIAKYDAGGNVLWAKSAGAVLMMKVLVSA